MKKSKLILLSSIVSLVLFTPFSVFANASSSNEPHAFALSFLLIAVILILAKVSGLVEKIGQPSVLGELVIGVIIGNLVLLGIHLFEPIKTDPIIQFLAELGVVILLFQIGLESNIEKMRKVGLRAFLVAVIGVVVPFVLGTYLVGPYLLPGLDPNAYLFIGATLTATSVGITARIFRDLRTLQTPEAQIVLGAAVIDDVLGLIILAVVSAIVTVGAVSFGMIGAITAKAVLFLVGAIVIGQLIAPFLGKAFAKISTGHGMKLTLAISFCLILAYFASKIGLAPIVGAFAAGLVLDSVHFKDFQEPNVIGDIKSKLANQPESLKKDIISTVERHAAKHVEELVEPIGHFLVPIFFVLTGVNVKLETLFDPKILFLALILTAVAFIGKIVSGLAAGKVNKLIVGVGMIPRGEVGLIFASIGRSLGVIDDTVFSIIIIMVILSTLITPPVLAALIRRKLVAT